MKTVLEFWLRQAQHTKARVLYVPYQEWNDLLLEMNGNVWPPMKVGDIRDYQLNGVHVRPFPPLPIRVWGSDD